MNNNRSHYHFLISKIFLSQRTCQIMLSFLANIQFSWTFTNHIFMYRNSILCPSQNLDWLPRTWGIARLDRPCFKRKDGFWRTSISAFCMHVIIFYKCITLFHIWSLCEFVVMFSFSCVLNLCIFLLKFWSYAPSEKYLGPKQSSPNVTVTLTKDAVLVLLCKCFLLWWYPCWWPI